VGEKRRVDCHGGSARKVVAQVPVEEVRVDVASDFGFSIFFCEFGLRFSSMIPFVGRERERESAETERERERERERAG
jgi:hypothetical protein